MELSEFKKKLDNREFLGGNSKEMWDAAYKWQEQANKHNRLIKWSWDCGLKLDYDGDVCRISSRFYHHIKVLLNMENITELLL